MFCNNFTLHYSIIVLPAELNIVHWSQSGHLQITIIGQNGGVASKLMKTKLLLHCHIQRAKMCISVQRAVHLITWNITSSNNLSVPCLIFQNLLRDHDNLYDPKAKVPLYIINSLSYGATGIDFTSKFRS